MFKPMFAILASALPLTAFGGISGNTFTFGVQVQKTERQGDSMRSKTIANANGALDISSGRASYNRIFEDAETGQDVEVSVDLFMFERDGVKEFTVLARINDQVAQVDLEQSLENLVSLRVRPLYGENSAPVNYELDVQL